MTLEPGGRSGADAAGTDPDGREGAVDGRDRTARWAVVCVVLLWALYAVPFVLGDATFFLRDVTTTHLPLKAFGAAELRAGDIPAVNPTWALGQPYRGNPNTFSLYPGNLLYLVLPFWSAFNLHYLLHWLLAFFTMRALARRLGGSGWASLFAGVAYAGGGWMLSALVYANLLTVAAWWPLVLLGARSRSRRGLALGGLACGMALLGGEPVTALLGTVPALVAAREGRPWHRAFGRVFVIGAVGLVVAAPQIVATLRIFGGSIRGAGGYGAALAGRYALHPLRLLELVIPLPWGWPFHVGRDGLWAASVMPSIAYFVNLHLGIVALWLALRGVQRRWRWGGLAAAGLLVAWLGGLLSGTLWQLSFGLFRYPEKFVFWSALALPLLAAWGLDRVVSSERPGGRVAVVAAGVLAVAGGALLLARPSLLAGADWGVRTDVLAIADTTLFRSGLYLVAAGLLLAAAVWAARRRSGLLLVLLNCLALAQLAPLVQRDSSAPYRHPRGWASRVDTGAAVANVAQVNPEWSDTAEPSYPVGSYRGAHRLMAAALSFSPGVYHGLDYPLAPDLEGMHSVNYAFALARMSSMSWRQRIHWARHLGLDWLVAFEAIEVPGLTLADRREIGEETVWLFGVEGPAPRAWWPRRMRRVEDREAAIRAVAENADPLREAVITREISHRGGGRVDVVTWEPDRIVLEVEGGGGVVVVQRAYLPLYRARLADRPSQGRRAIDPEIRSELAMGAVDAALIGVQVPPGEHRVVIDVSAVPETIALGVSIVALSALGLLLLGGQPGRRSA